MDCNETDLYLEADSDGELDAIRHLELETHLRSCPACAKKAEAVAARHHALRERLPRFQAPDRLAERIRIAVREEGRAAAAPSARVVGFPAYWAPIGLAASLALAVLGGYAWGSVHMRAGLQLDEAVTEHVRSLQASHLMDVASTDQHTVKPWFSGKLDFSPPVADLADAGFPLVGGRLEHLSGRDAAALIFRRRQHVINVFIWPAAGGGARPSSGRRDGYNARGWSQGDLDFMAVSEIPDGELGQFVEAFRERTSQ